MKKTTMKRELYTFFCSQVTGEVNIPEAKEIKKLVDETREMDRVGRVLIERTYDELESVVENGHESCEFCFSTNKTNLTKRAMAQVIKAWKDYMKAKGYNTSTFLEDGTYWHLSFNWENKE